jgi:hypothetical protein
LVDSKGELTDADQLFDAVDEIFTSLPVATIGEVFRNWIHRLEQVIELNDYFVGSRFSDIENTALSWSLSESAPGGLQPPAGFTGIFTDETTSLTRIDRQNFVLSVTSPVLNNRDSSKQSRIICCLRTVETE